MTAQHQVGVDQGDAAKVLTILALHKEEGDFSLLAGPAGAMILRKMTMQLLFLHTTLCQIFLRRISCIIAFHRLLILFVRFFFWLEGWQRAETPLLSSSSDP